MEAVQTLALKYAVRFPADTARRLETLANADVSSFLAELDPETAAGIVVGMPPATAGAAFEAMSPDALKAILAVLPVSRCVPVLRSLGKKERATMVGLLPTGVAPVVERLLRSPEGSAGDLAEPVPAVLSPEMSVDEARHIVGFIPGRYVFVVDDDSRLVGVMHRNELVKSDPRARIGNLMATPVTRLPSAAPHSAVRDHQAWNDFDVLPVVDDAGVLVGVVRHRSVRRSGHMTHPGSASSRPALAIAIELAELYWGGLTSLFASMSNRFESEGPAEVKHGA